MNSSDISVIIPTFNGFDHLKRMIESLEQQQPDPSDFQVVIVDDGSTDGTGEYLEHYSGKLKLDALKLPTNSGRSHARNVGAGKAEREILLFLDGDMLLPPTLIACHALQHDGSDRVVIGRVQYPREIGCHGYARYLESRGVMKLKSGERVPGRYFLSGHASMPKSLFKKLGGFDEDFRFYGEDLDLGIRLDKMRATLRFEPDLSITHLHIRTLCDAIRVTEEYGRVSLPVLVQKHPELMQELRLTNPNSGWLNRITFRILFSAPIFRSIFCLTNILNNIAAPSVFYSYLIFRSYYKGFQNSSNST
jgi:glycosyltransferase involved in cell wall biosynthesis